MVKSYKIIAIDGPSSSGKGTIAKLVAKKLGFSYLDSGSIYRALGLLAVRNKLIETDIKEVLGLLVQMNLSFHDNGVYIDNEDVTNLIRDEHVGMMASRLSKHNEVREALLDFQRSFATSDNLVTDGRDMGSVVFPSADLKVFLTASAEKRAERRYKQLHFFDRSVKIEAILHDIIVRDKQDSERAIAPLRFTHAYRLLDNTHLTIDECVGLIISWFKGTTLCL